MPAGTCRTSDGPGTGPAGNAGPGTSGTTTPLSTSRATSRPPRAIAPSAQSGPPSSAEPTVRPGPARQVAPKRGRDAAARLPNNPETGCRRDEHYHSLTGNGVAVAGHAVDTLLRPVGLALEQTGGSGGQALRGPVNPRRRGPPACSSPPRPRSKILPVPANPKAGTTHRA